MVAWPLSLASPILCSVLPRCLLSVAPVSGSPLRLLSIALITDSPGEILLQTLHQIAFVSLSVLSIAKALNRGLGLELIRIYGALRPGLELA
ncbi:hypothetical protein CDL15_Pgr000601 [Punica granatum]|uniref:Secreted protein n=1 Tax=Punica granatum TaxID=22663 RepID=A0A218W3N2_PUNGR|nr:hypothetical protein CDL15_Pgr000601 [Punica granatum]